MSKRFNTYQTLDPSLISEKNPHLRDIRNAGNINRQQTQENELPIHKNASFKHGTLLFLSLLPPIGILLAFGGQISLTVFTIGAIITYIFDLMGSLEATILGLFLTITILWGTLIFQARLFVVESFWNISIVLFMGLTLACFFLTMLGQFTPLLHELGFSMTHIETILFVTIPFISSVLITWFLSVEIPSFDASITFVCVYFVYQLHLYYPRTSNINTLNDKNYVIPSNIVVWSHIVPMIVAPVLNYASHHQVLFTSFKHTLPLLISIVLPILLTSICLRDQISYFITSDKNTSLFNQIISFIQLFSGAVLISSIQIHPFFDDLKGLSYKSKTFISIAICILAFDVAFTLGIQRIRHRLLSTGYDRKSFTVLILSLLALLSTALGALLVSIILHLPRNVHPISVIGGLALLDYYNDDIHKTDLRSIIWVVIRVIIASWSIAVLFQYFLDQTVSSLAVTFQWIFDVTIQQLCGSAAAIVATSIVVSAIGKWIRLQSIETADYLPSLSSIGSVTTNNSNSKWALPTYTFELLFQFVAMLVAAMELLIREQVIFFLSILFIFQSLFNFKIGLEFRYGCEC